MHSVTQSFATGQERAGQRVGEYEIVREIARGAMGIVFLARQPALGRHVALKELMRFPSDSGSLAQRFLQESKVAGSLAHPSIVSVYNYFEAEGVPYIAMEYLERGSLREYMGRLSLPQIAGVLEGLLAGLAYAESKHIVHRDLKPENLLVSANGTIQIADFGIAKALKQVSQHLTATGTTVGTFAYMAPEQAMGRRDLGPAADLYSVGVIAHELVLGRTPFRDEHGDEPLALLMKVVNDPLPPPAELDPDLDPGLAAWLESMLAKSPADRPQRAEEAWDQLEDIVLRLLGPVWRRDARLLLQEAVGEEEVKPLSEAEFPSMATPIPIDAANDYLTYAGGDPAPPEPPASAGEPAVIPPAPTAPVARHATAAQPLHRDETPAYELDYAAMEPEVAVTRLPVAPTGDVAVVVPEPGAPARPRRRWRRYVACAAVAATVAGGGFFGSTQLGASTPPKLDLGPVEKQVRARLAPGNQVDAVSCPAGVISQVHQTFDCTAELAGGGSMRVSVTQSDAAGHFAVEPHL